MALLVNERKFFFGETLVDCGCTEHNTAHLPVLLEMDLEVVCAARRINLVRALAIIILR